MTQKAVRPTHQNSHEPTRLATHARGHAAGDCPLRYEVPATPTLRPHLPAAARTPSTSILADATEIDRSPHHVGTASLSGTAGSGCSPVVGTRPRQPPIRRN